MSGAELVDRINSMLKHLNIPKSKFYSDLALSNNACTKWSTGAYPSSLTLYSISKYLNVSMEYLIAGEELQISLDDLELLKNYHSMSDDFQKLIKMNIEELNKLC